MNARAANLVGLQVPQKAGDGGGGGEPQAQ